MNLKQAKKIYCIGIGGIGVSALAQLWKAQGKEVSGSDASGSEITQALVARGIQVRLPSADYRLPQFEHVDVMVYSDAVPEDHPERVAVRTQGVSEMSYAQALGEVSKEYKTIVVTGTHGKSTTTAMLGLILEAAGFDPLVLVGSRVPEWGNGNLRLPAHVRHPEERSDEGSRTHVRSVHRHEILRYAQNDKPLFVVEGDDYRDHFLELNPYAVVVTSIEHDHPDYFRDLAHTVTSFTTLAEKVSKDGFVVLNGDDHGCQQLAQSLSRTNGRLLRYGSGGEIFKNLKLQVPGEFNRYNATAAATCAMALGVSRDVVQKAVGEFKGIWRRFEVVGEMNVPLRNPPQKPYSVSPAGKPVLGAHPRSSASGGYRARSDSATFLSKDSATEQEEKERILIISDYGHHPTAIRETMKAAREAYPGRRLVLVYQPHQHSRTKHLFNDFVEVLKDAADVVILSEIYAVKGRMEDRNVSSKEIVEAIKRTSLRDVWYGGTLEETKRMVLDQVQGGDVAIFMGAGDIDQVAREMVQ